MLLQLLFQDPIVFFIVFISIILAISIHEYFHAWTAYSLGDPTAQYQGRLTVNPLAHLDPLGTILLLIVGFGWGKPVPFNPYNLRNQKWGPAIVGLAGPVSNFFMALIIGLILRFFPISNSDFYLFLGLFVWINLILGIFNLIPIPPLDGSHIFLTAAPAKVKIFFMKNNLLLIIGIIFFLYYFGFDFIIRPLYTLITGAPPLFK